MPQAHAPQSPFIPFLAGFSLALGAAILVWPSEDPDVRTYREVRDWTEAAYVRPVGRTELLDDALRGLASGLDEYSTWYDRSELARIDRETGGRYLGVGVSLLQPFSEGRILFPLAGSPAEAAGILPGDRILRVDGHPYAELGHDGFRALVGAPEPREVELAVAGLDGAERSVLVRTASVVEPTVRHEEILDAGRGLGYVSVRAFSHETPGELDAALERLEAQGLRGLVLDLRGNPGGVLTAAVQAAQRFVRAGTLVRTEGRDDVAVHADAPERARWWGLPLVVLVDGASASASEVLAGALQDHRAAVLVGEPTYGKGLVQTIHRLRDGSGAVKITTSRYTTPSGRHLDRSESEGAAQGLVPDIVVELDAAARAAVHAHLQRPSPPVRWRAAIAAWQARVGAPLWPPAPADPQLDAALALLRGERPGPHAAGEGA